VQAVDPSVALRPRVARLTRTADAFGALAAELADAFHASRRRHDPVRLLEVIAGTTAIRSTLEELQRQARTEMLWLCKASPVAMPSATNTEEFRALDRGVGFRVIYERTLLTEPGMMADIAAGIERGEQARVLPSLPVRLAIADGTTAVLPLTITLAPGEEPTAAIIHDSALSYALVNLFEQLWERATPLERLSETDLDDGDGGPLPLDPDDRYLLSLLVSGIPDKAIASQMGVSTRTVQRRVSTLMEAMSVETRVELAYVVGRHRALP
jgi:DNA-binding NarL/FixJ family response regulator